MAKNSEGLEIVFQGYSCLPIFEYTPDAHTPLWPDVSYMHEVLGHTKVPWREGFRRMIEARHPELSLEDT